MTEEKLLSLIRQAMNADKYALQMEYVDAAGDRTRRTVSPIRMQEAGFLALCLGRMEPRHFKLSGVRSATLVKAEGVLAPVEIEGE